MNVEILTLLTFLVVTFQLLQTANYLFTEEPIASPVFPRGGYCHIWAIWVCAPVTGMVFKQFTLG